MSAGRQKKGWSKIPPRLRWHSLWPWLVLLWLLTTLGLGVWGFCLVYPSPELPLWREGCEALYRTLQLFVLNFETLSQDQINSMPLPLWFARFMAPLLFFGAAVRLFFYLYYEKLQLLRIRMWWRNHIVICGLGVKGAKLAKELRGCQVSIRRLVAEVFQGKIRFWEFVGRIFSRRLQVVAIELDDRCPEIALCKAEGVKVVIGDATKEYVFNQVALQKAAYLYIVTGNDKTNIEIAVQAFTLAKHWRRKYSPLKCSLNVVETTLVDLFRNHELFTDPEDLFDVRIFNFYEQSSRMIFKLYPPDLKKQLKSDDPNAFHLYIIGFGWMGQALAIRAVQTCVFANHTKVRITVVDKNLEHTLTRFKRRHPTLEQVCDLHVKSMDIEDVVAFTEDYRADEQSGKGYGVIYVCLGDDMQTIQRTLEIAKALSDLEHQITGCLWNATPLVPLIKHQLEGTEKAKASKTTPKPNVFTMLQEACTEETLMRQEQDALARAFHAIYIGVHFVFLGFPKSCHELAKTLAAKAYKGQIEKIRVTMIASAAEFESGNLHIKRLKKQYQCDVVLIPGDPQDLKQLDQALSIGNYCTDGRNLIYACFEERPDFLLAPSLVAHPILSKKIAVVNVVIPESWYVDDAHRTRIAVQEQDQRIYYCCWSDQRSSTQSLAPGHLQSLTTDFYRSFIEVRREDPAQEPWHKLDEQLKESNRLEVDHIVVKLRAINCSLLDRRTITGNEENLEEVENFSEAEVDLLARMEHQRWMTERILAGWKYGPKSDKPNKINKNLVPWNQLSQETRDYNLQAIRNLILILRETGQKVVRNLN